MSATYSTNAGLPTPNLNDTDYPATFTALIALLDALEAIGQFRLKAAQTPSTSLVVAHSGGTVAKNNGVELVVAGGNLTMTANQTNYVYVDSSGAVQQNTTGYPAAAILKVGAVLAGSSSITSIAHAKTLYRQAGANLSAELLALSGGTLTGLLALQGTGAGAGFQFVATAAPGSPADGQFWYDSTAKAVLGSVGGATMRPQSTQYFATASATVASTTSETTLLGSGTGSATIPANLVAAAKYVRLRGRGFISTTGSPTATVNLKLGSYVLTSGAISPGTGVANIAFEFDAEFAIRGTGALATIIGQGWVSFNGVRTPIVSTSTSTIDTTSSQTAAATLTWSASSASNTATVTQATVEIIH